MFALDSPLVYVVERCIGAIVAFKMPTLSLSIKRPQRMP